MKPQWQLQIDGRIYNNPSNAYPTNSELSHPMYILETSSSKDRRNSGGTFNDF